MIQNLIFDLGNVLVSYRWKEMLTDDFGIEETHAKELGHRMCVPQGMSGLRQYR